MKGKTNKKVDLNQLAFLQILAEEKLPLPTMEYQFFPERKWRADYCWINHLVVMETEGGIWSNGRHTRGSGFLGDIEKYNKMTLLGYRLIRVPTPDLCKKETIDMLKQLLQS